jgi:hypothetical protein
VCLLGAPVTGGAPVTAYTNCEPAKLDGDTSRGCFFCPTVCAVHNYSNSACSVLQPKCHELDMIKQMLRFFTQCTSISARI